MSGSHLEQLRLAMCVALAWRATVGLNSACSLSFFDLELTLHKQQQLVCILHITYSLHVSVHFKSLETLSFLAFAVEFVSTFQWLMHRFSSAL